MSDLTPAERLAILAADTATPCQADPRPYLDPEGVDAETLAAAAEACSWCPLLAPCQGAVAAQRTVGVLQAGRVFNLRARGYVPRRPKGRRGTPQQPRVSVPDCIAAALDEAGSATLKELHTATGMTLKTLRVHLVAEPARFEVVGLRRSTSNPARVWGLRGHADAGECAA